MSVPSTTRWPLIALLWVTGLLAAMQFAKVTLTLDALAVAYPDAPIAFAVSAVAVVGMVFGIIAGSIVARIGARRSILWAMLASAAMSLAQALPLPFAGFMTLRVLEGFGHLALVIALPTMMAAQAAPQMRSIVMAIWGTFFGVGFALNALALPVLMGLGGERAVYAAHGVALLAMLPVLWAGLPRIIHDAPKVPGFVAVHRQMYSDARLIAPGVGHGIYTSLFIALIAVLPTALDALWLAAMLPLVNLAGTFAAGFVAKVIAPGRLASLSFGLAAVGFAALVLVPHPIIALIAIAFTGLCAGANFAAIPALNTSPTSQARANGGMAQLGNVGTFTGTPLFAWWVASGAPGGAAGLACGICLFGAALSAVVYSAAKRGPRPPLNHGDYSR